MEREMAPGRRQRSAFGARSQICVVLLLLHNPLAAHGVSGWGGCLDGQDVFAAVAENSPPVIVSPDLFDELADGAFSWTLRGKDADWFYLDGANLWLNTSADRVLDREAEGSVLIAELVCFEQDVLQSVYRIVLEILNENDNGPVFVNGTEQAFIISELTPVNAVVFNALATDADYDVIVYSIDPSSPDAEYFKILLPHSGSVVLAKPLDYETKTLLNVIVHASELSTAEQYSTTTNISISVEDGDDQYPHFTPCTVLLEEATARVCTNPTYTANVTYAANAANATEGPEHTDLVLTFSPGPIHAVDGDRGLSAALSYVILTGNDDGHFLMDRNTGAMSLTHAVTDRLSTAAFHLQVMAFQDDDPRKYSVAAVVVRVLPLNRFAPRFERSEYSGFVTVGDGPAALVRTYGSRALVLTVTDPDFSQSINPMMVFSLSPTSNHTELYSITQKGLVIVRTGPLSSGQRHVLQVRATDQESGESTFATVTVEVLARGLTAPRNDLSSPRGRSGCVVGKAVFLGVTIVSVLICIFYLGLWIKKKQRGHRDPLERGSVAQGKHPNVSLRWFQLVSHGGGALSQMEDLTFSTDDGGTPNPVFSFIEKDAPSHVEPSRPKSANEKATAKEAENTSVGGSESIPETPPDPSESPNLSSPLCRRASSPRSPEQVPVRARLVHIGSSTCDSPLKALEAPPPPETEPATSLDNSDHSSGAANAEGHEEAEEVFLDEGNESPDLLPDEEELLNVMERCHPVFITFKKF